MAGLDDQAHKRGVLMSPIHATGWVLSLSLLMATLSFAGEFEGRANLVFARCEPSYELARQGTVSIERNIIHSLERTDHCPSELLLNNRLIFRIGEIDEGRKSCTYASLLWPSYRLTCALR